MIAGLLIFGVLVALFWWCVIGAIALACLQDSYRASDDRDPMVKDLPIWWVIACGPIAWLIRFYDGRAK